MSRHSRSGGDMTLVMMILVGLTVWTHREQLLDFTYVACGVAIFLFILYAGWRYATSAPSEVLVDIDSMDGLAFERYVADLLYANGFHRVSLTERYDFGVDIIAEKDGVRWGVQVKRHAGLVKASAVRQVVTGLRMYGCHRAMVITNSTFSATAQRLAKGNDCVLVDRTGLDRLINNRGVIL